MALKRVVDPTILPLTLAEVKLHLREDSTDNDALIQILLQAAVDYVDGSGGFLGRALVSQTWQLTIDEFPINEVKLPLPPLIEVLSVAYDDGAGNEQILDPSLYAVDDQSEPGWVLPIGSWPSTFSGANAVRITYRAGYVDTSFSPPTGEVPGNIKAGMLLYIGSMFANREEVVAGTIAATLPWGADALLRRSRVEVSMA